MTGIWHSASGPSTVQMSALVAGRTKENNLTLALIELQEAIPHLELNTI